jgi:hypothetical protein
MKLTLYSYKDEREVLLIYLGESNGFTFGLESNQIPTNEKNLIKSMLSKTPPIPTNQFMLFLKKYCPHAYSKGYRKIATANLRELKSYDI